MARELQITGNDLSLTDVMYVAYHKTKVVLSKQAMDQIDQSRAIIEKIVENETPIYGVNTGFGNFSDVSISKQDTAQLQENLIRSHACGFGPILEEPYVRATMLLRINALSKGYSGIRLSTVEMLLRLLNEDIIPVIPEKGSLGASGDLAPLSHMVMPMLGLGEVIYQGKRQDSIKVLDQLGIKPISLAAKEGLALINGTQVLTAIGAITTYQAQQLTALSDMAAALTIEALRGITDAFDPRIHAVRNHQGQIDTAANLLQLLKGSTYTSRQGQLRIQDAYSLRCTPQVHGASKTTIRHVKTLVENELNAVTDNPIVTKEGDVYSGGNFHGEPMAQAFDYLAIGIAELASISERRLERLINHQLNDLPAFLTADGGLSSGYMITQYAAASLVSENKILAHPASVDSIPSSANQEDIVSMGTIAARKARDIAANTKRVLATEIMAACHAVDFRKEEGLTLSANGQALYDRIREVIPFFEKDNTIEMYKLLDLASETLSGHFIARQVDSLDIKA